MKGTVRTTTVNGINFEVWSDFIRRGTFAMNIKTGEVKQISFSGYIHADLTTRKAIANTFGIATFRK